MAGAAKIIQTDDGYEGTVDEAGRLAIPTPEGCVIYRTSWRPKKRSGASKHDENLALELPAEQLGQLGSDLLREIEADDRSRAEYLQTLAKGVEWLGVRVEDAAGAANDSSAPLEGMSTFRHPLLLQAAIRFQADFIAEFLPPDGPVKIRDDSTQPPPGALPPLPPGAPAPMTEGDLADALQKDFNHYLTQTATEFYPDTARFAFKLGLNGPGFKKVYHCPLRRRPVSESVDAADLIVDYTATDLANAERVTHRIRMHPSKMRRMMRLGVYREVPLNPGMVEQNQVEQAESRAAGITPSTALTGSHPYIVYECCTELDIETEGDYAPYKVVIEKGSQQVLAVYRNWSQGDKLRKRRDEFVDYGYLNAIGFYALGLVHVLGNTVKALTMAYREFLDGAAFSNFPGFLFASDAGEQLTNEFRAAPGSGVPINTGGRPISAIVSPLPYHAPDVASLQFIQHIEEMGKALGGEATVPLGESAAAMPVGTMLAQIEQALKPIKGVFRSLHSSQAREFRLLRNRFLEDPEAFWRFNPDPAHPWSVPIFLQALNDADLAPAADPNTSSHVQRVAIAWALLELAKQAPYLFHQRDTALRFLRMIGVPDPEDIMATVDEVKQAQAAMQPPAPQGPPGKAPNPMLDSAKAQQAQAQAQLSQAKAQQAQMQTQQGQQMNAVDLASKQQAMQARAAEMALEARERDADRQAHLQIATMNHDAAVKKTGADLAQAGAKQASDADVGAAQRAHEAATQGREHAHAAGLAAVPQTTQEQEPINDVP